MAGNSPNLRWGDPQFQSGGVPDPVVGSLVSGTATNFSKFKTELCHSFTATGRCRQTTSCFFAHGRGELRTEEMNGVRGGLVTTTEHVTSGTLAATSASTVRVQSEQQPLLQAQQAQQQLVVKTPQQHQQPQPPQHAPPLRMGDSKHQPCSHVGEPQPPQADSVPQQNQFQAQLPQQQQSLHQVAPQQQLQQQPVVQTPQHPQQYQDPQPPQGDVVGQSQVQHILTGLSPEQAHALLQLIQLQAGGGAQAPVVAAPPQPTATDQQQPPPQMAQHQQPFHGQVRPGSPPLEVHPALSPFALVQEPAAVNFNFPEQQQQPQQQQQPLFQYVTLQQGFSQPPQADHVPPQNQLQVQPSQQERQYHQIVAPIQAQGAQVPGEVPPQPTAPETDLLEKSASVTSDPRVLLKLQTLKLQLDQRGYQEEVSPLSGRGILKRSFPLIDDDTSAFAPKRVTTGGVHAILPMVRVWNLSGASWTLEQFVDAMMLKYSTEKGVCADGIIEIGIRQSIKDAESANIIRVTPSFPGDGNGLVAFNEALLATYKTLLCHNKKNCDDISCLRSHDPKDLRPPLQNVAEGVMFSALDPNVGD